MNSSSRMTTALEPAAATRLKGESPLPEPSAFAEEHDTAEFVPGGARKDDIMGGTETTQNLMEQKMEIIISASPLISDKKQQQKNDDDKAATEPTEEDDALRNNWRRKMRFRQSQSCFSLTLCSATTTKMPYKFLLHIAHPYHRLGKIC
jgi:hypothetical protein